MAKKKEMPDIATEWFIYIPEEGHWPIKYNGNDPKKARKAYLKWAKRKRLPPGSFICNAND